jgi:hypothetical protein
MLLSQGKIVYFNEARLAVDYFARMGPKFACPSWNNPADFFMDMLSLDSIDSEDAEGKPMPRDLIVEEFN